MAAAPRRISSMAGSPAIIVSAISISQSKPGGSMSPTIGGRTTSSRSKRPALAATSARFFRTTHLSISARLRSKAGSQTDSRQPRRVRRTWFIRSRKSSGPRPRPSFLWKRAAEIFGSKRPVTEDRTFRVMKFLKSVGGTLACLILALASIAELSAGEPLFEGLSHRYANPQPENRKPLDEAYAAAMREVWKQFPDDPDVGALFAEAMMDLRPWDQWTLGGQPNPGTEEILATLDAVLKLNVNHPFANHLYIHAVEASQHPERADAAADRLRNLQPGLAHNVHMPSHIDIRRGRWQQAIETNVKAVAADKAFRKIVGPPTGLLPVYAAHNRHMLAHAAMMTGQGEVALKHVRAMVAELPAEWLKQFAAIADGFFAVPLEVLVRFGRWSEILAEPDKYPEGMPFVHAFQ